MAPRIWEASSPPPEDWETEDAGGEWQHNGIVSEETDVFNIKHYEVKWADWHRPDNTNTTWDQGLADMPEVIEAWDERQADKRAAEAKKSLSIKIPLEPGQLWHEDITVEMARGYNEKRSEGLRVGLQRYTGWDNVASLSDSESDGDEEQQEESSSGESSRPRSRRIMRDRPLSSRSPALAARRSNRGSSVRSDPRDDVRASQPRSKPPSSRQKPPSRIEATVSPPSNTVSLLESSPRPMKPLPRRKVIRIPSSESSEEDATDHRAKLQKRWTQVARRAGAATVTFVNEVNSERIPPGLEKFQYCEHHYIRAEGVPDPRDTSSCIVSCECGTRCVDTHNCDCQGPSELENDFEEKEYAYTEARLFKFNLPRGAEVIECNKNCSCSQQRCPNRVAQQPRDVPIEVFRTEDRGWGVRATVDLVRGKVLGIFTGEVITRKDAARRTGISKSYIFDLDVHEGSSDEEAEDDRRYSVDSYRFGNWTRFVNHSCEPNIRIYPVIWDSIPELNQPYLAFVATKAIPARTELTIDYEPGAALEQVRSKGKGKFRLPPGASPCMCGADNCRGWVRV